MTPLVNVVIDAVGGDGVTAERQRLAALDAQRHRAARLFASVRVPEERLLSVQPYDPAASLGASLRLNGSLALGVGAPVLHADRVESAGR